MDRPDQSPGFFTASKAGYAALLLGFSALVFFVGFLSLYAGPAALELRDVTNALFDGPASGDPAAIIVWKIRFPRTLMGAMVGGSLGLSGAVLQGYLRNPLAEPGIIGVTSGAALGGVLAIHSGLAAGSLFLLPVFGLVGGFLAVLLILGLAGLRGSPLTLILAGVAVTSLGGALTSLVLSLSNNPFAITEIVFWMLGSLTDRSMAHVVLAGPLIIPGLGLLMLTGRALDALTLGEEGARNLGVNVDRLRMLIITGVALSVGAATAIAGAIGFVGLIVPHVLRPLVQHQPGRLLGISALGGAVLVLLADIVVRLMQPEYDIKLGVLTAVIGAPFFFYLVLRTRRDLII